MHAQIQIPEDEIARFCGKWKVREFSVFGSVLREDFRPDSDVDVLVSFEENSGISLWDMAEMKIELESLFGREVDLVTKEGLVNPYRRYTILTTREVVYGA